MQQSSGTGGGSNRKDLLDIKEKELAAREAELNRREEELRKAGALVPKKNWPICYPILHHDIAGDVSSTQICHARHILLSPKWYPCPHQCHCPHMHAG